MVSTRAKPQPLETRHCEECGADFTAKPSHATRFCNRTCWAKNKSAWKAQQGNRLQHQVIAEMRRRKLSGIQAAAAIGIAYPTLSSWFNVADRRLQRPQVAAIAAWLSIDAGEATRLQGGSAEERQAEIARAAVQAPARQQHVARLKADPDYRTAVYAPVSAASKKPKRRETRERMRTAAAEAWQRPTARAAHLRASRSLRGKARAVFASMVAKHPNASREELAKLAAQRMTRPPYNVTTVEAAAALLAPKPRAKPTRQRAARRPHRCAILIELDAKYPRAGAKRTYGFMAEYRRLIEAIEGDNTPGEADLWKDIYRHCRACPKHRARTHFVGR